MSGELQGKTLFISGGSRGIGLTIAVRAARDGANVCLIPQDLRRHRHLVRLPSAYTISKFGMSTLTMGMAEEFRPDGVAFTALWPRTLIATAAVQNLLGGDVAKKGSRRPEIMADAAHAIFTRPARGTTGTFFIDEDVLHETGVGDFGPHGFGPESSEADLIPDLYV